ncbi:MAG: hypothetical protein AAB443_01420 [Patescibacteria group bacterium]
MQWLRSHLKLLTTVFVLFLVVLAVLSEVVLGVVIHQERINTLETLQAHAGQLEHLAATAEKLAEEAVILAETAVSEKITAEAEATEQAVIRATLMEEIATPEPNSDYTICSGDFAVSWLFDLRAGPLTVDGNTFFLETAEEGVIYANGGRSWRVPKMRIVALNGISHLCFSITTWPLVLVFGNEEISPPKGNFTIPTITPTS